MQDPIQPGQPARDPSQPFYDLNLAGAQGVPTPMSLRQQAPDTLNAPDFVTPDHTMPSLQSHDLSNPALTQVPAFLPDPSLPDLQHYTDPDGVMLMNQQGMLADPQLAADMPTPAELAASLYPGLGFDALEVRHDLNDSDPLLPDLQQSIVVPQRTMLPDERPTALETLHTLDQYQQITNHQYPDSQMEQHGNNSWRARHLSLLDSGLEEH